MNESSTVIETTSSIAYLEDISVSYHNNVTTLLFFIIIFIAVLTGVILGCFFYKFFKN